MGVSFPSVVTPSIGGSHMTNDVGVVGYGNLTATAEGIIMALSSLSYDFAIHDPSDMSTMFQDYAGTTPVTGVEQPIGLHLDKSNELQLGPELVTNGDFSGGTTGWTVTDAGLASLSSVAGELIVTTTGVAGAQQARTTVSGKFYKLTAKIRKIAGTDVRVRAVDSTFAGTILAESAIVTSSTATEVTVIFKALSASSVVYLRCNGTGTGGFDDVSVKEIPGYHATQSITASRPTLSARYNLLLNSSTLSTQNVTTVAAQHTLSFTGTGTVTLSGTATGSLVGTGVSDRVSLTFTPTAGTLTLTVTGSVTLAMLNLGTSAMTYQAITTATSYDSNPLLFPWYLKYDGIDDYMNLPYIGLYASGACSLVVARDAVSQATDSYVISERSTTDADPKYFPSRQLASGGNMDSYIVSDEGTVRLDTVGSAFGGSANAVIRSVVDSGANIRLFKGGVNVADDNYTRAGVLTLNTTTIGASVSTTTSNYVNQKIYGSIIVKGAALTDKQRRLCEQYLARKVGVQLA